MTRGIRFPRRIGLWMITLRTWFFRQISEDHYQNRLLSYISSTTLSTFLYRNERISRWTHNTVELPIWIYTVIKRWMLDTHWYAGGSNVRTQWCKSTTYRSDTVPERAALLPLGAVLYCPRVPKQLSRESMSTSVGAMQYPGRAVSVPRGEHAIT